MEEFGIGTSVVQWLTTGYLLVVSVVTPLSSYLNHRSTLKASFAAAVALCIAGLPIAAASVIFPMLMIARILQGAGTGVALPLMFNISLSSRHVLVWGCLWASATWCARLRPRLVRRSVAWVSRQLVGVGCSPF